MVATSISILADPAQSEASRASCAMAKGNSRSSRHPAFLPVNIDEKPARPSSKGVRSVLQNLAHLTRQSFAALKEKPPEPKSKPAKPTPLSRPQQLDLFADHASATPPAR
ncbi:MAG: hypothetical protein BGO12_09935 [Verrucomicrobia bacterium 61-8]|nr:hypothetical protein [Verrucomicrobiota bacterium]OJV03520.1 MAG: hypothetical protein BGO12_09935 [Verrucomicrobia bacterium 61-8]